MNESNDINNKQTNNDYRKRKTPTNETTNIHDI